MLGCDLPDDLLHGGARGVLDVEGPRNGLQWGPCVDIEEERYLDGSFGFECRLICKPWGFTSEKFYQMLRMDVFPYYLAKCYENAIFTVDIHKQEDALHTAGLLLRDILYFIHKKKRPQEGSKCMSELGILQELSIILVRELYSSNFRIMCKVDGDDDDCRCHDGHDDGDNEQSKTRRRTLLPVPVLPEEHNAMVGCCVLLAYKFLSPGHPIDIGEITIILQRNMLLNANDLARVDLKSMELNVFSCLGYNVQKPTVLGICSLGLYRMGTRLQGDAQGLVNRFVEWWDLLVALVLCSYHDIPGDMWRSAGERTSVDRYKYIHSGFCLEHEGLCMTLQNAHSTDQRIVAVAVVAMTLSQLNYDMEFSPDDSEVFFREFCMCIGVTEILQVEHSHAVDQVVCNVLWAISACSNEYCMSYGTLRLYKGIEDDAATLWKKSRPVCKTI